MYAIHLSAVDKAGNIKMSRKLVLYDNLSKVTFNVKRNTRVETASSQTNFTWVTKETNKIFVKWWGRFINHRHDNSRWLTKINPYPKIDRAYDDFDGRRTVDEVPNIQGILVTTTRNISYGGGEIKFNRARPVHYSVFFSMIHV